MTPTDSLIHDAVHSMNRRRFQITALSAVVPASLFVLAGALFITGYHPVWSSLALLAAFFVLYSLRQQLFAEAITEEQAAIFLDTALSAKGRFAAYVELIRTKRDSDTGKLSIVAGQLAPFASRSPKPSTLIPLALSQKLRRLLYVGPIIWFAVLAVVYFYQPILTTPAARAIQQVLDEQKALPASVREELEELRDTLNDSSSSSSEITAALENSRKEIESARSGSDTTRTIESTESADESKGQESKEGSSTESPKVTLSAQDLSKQNEPNAKPATPTPTATPSPTSTPTSSPPPSDKKDQEKKKDVDVQNSEPSKDPSEKESKDSGDSKSKDDGGGGKGKSDDKDQKQDSEGSGGSASGSKDGQGKGSSGEKKGEQSGAEGQGESGEQKKSESKDSGSGGKAQKESQSGEKSEQQRALDAAQSAVDEAQKEQEKGREGDKEDDKQNGGTKGEGEKEQSQGDKTEGKGKDKQGEEKEQQKSNPDSGKGGEEKAKKPGEDKKDGDAPISPEGKGDQSQKNEPPSKAGNKGVGDKGESPGKGDLPPAPGNKTREKDSEGGSGRKPGDANDRGYKDSTIEDKSESIDSRFTGEEATREENAPGASPKTTLSDVTLARPSTNKDRSEQLIPPEYREELR